MRRETRFLEIKINFNLHKNVCTTPFDILVHMIIIYLK